MMIWLRNGWMTKRNEKEKFDTRIVSVQIVVNISCTVIMQLKQPTRTTLFLENCDFSENRSLQDTRSLKG